MIAKPITHSPTPSTASRRIEATAGRALRLPANEYFGGLAMPTDQPTLSPVSSARPRLSLKISRIEYRIQWDDAAGTWDVLRNGIATDVVARRKRNSAVASAIRDAKAEFKTSNGTVVVTCIEGGKLETLWRGTQ